MENKFWILVALAAGVAVGMNWKKIEKHLGPSMKTLEGKTVDAYGAILKFCAQQKEHLEDMIAAAKIQKSRPVTSAKGRSRRSGDRKGKLVAMPA